MNDCPLCCSIGGRLVWKDGRCRVVFVEGAEAEAFPGYCRVVWDQHICEMTDLPEQQRHHLMRVVYAVESALMRLVRPDKVNLAALGNQVPHLHWHVIPRWRDDSHFPDAIWSAACRPAPRRQVPTLDCLRSAVEETLLLEQGS